MKKTLLFAGVMALAITSGAVSQTSTSLPVKNGSGTTVNIAGQNDASTNFHYRDVMEGLTVGGVPTPVLTDGSGNQYTNIVGTLPAFASTPTVNCGTGCYQATQPISGSVSVSNFPGSQAVTGTFWQATQPVSLTALPALATGANAIGSITNTSFAATQATASNFNAQVVGNVASGATDSGNPISVAGVYNSTLPTLTTGQRGVAQSLSDGSLRSATVLYPSAGRTGISANIGFPFAQGYQTTTLQATQNAIWNGATSDVMFSASAANATTGTGVAASGIMGVYNSTPPTYTTGQYGNVQLTASGAVQVAASNPSTIYAAQKTVGTTASCLSSQALVNQIVVTALPSNSAAIYVGPSGVTTATGYVLQPGASTPPYAVTNASAVCIISAASTTDAVSATGN